MRNVFYGLVVGFMLSALRAPLGIDLLQMPGVEAANAYSYRALALALIALAWWLKAEGTVSIAFLASTAVAFALHALVLSAAWAPTSAAQLWIVGLLGFAALVWLGRGDMLNEREAAADRPTFLQMLGLCAAGAGVAVALESVARHVRLFGGGLAQDDSVSASVLLVCAAIGALACGWMAASTRLRALSFPAGLAATATGCFASLHALGGITTARGLSAYLHAYGLDTSSHAMLAYDVLIAATCFVLPAVLLGATLRGVRSKLDLSSALLGAALGLYFVPRLLTMPEHRGVGELEIFSAQLVPFGCLTAVGGSALALLSTTALGTKARWSGLAFTLLLCLAPLMIVVSPKLVIAPWMTVPPRQLIVFDSPEGLVTVEPSDGGLPMAMLDRHAITPPTEAAVADMDRIKLAVAMVPAERWVLRTIPPPSTPADAPDDSKPNASGDSVLNPSGDSTPSSPGDSKSTSSGESKRSSSGESELGSPGQSKRSSSEQGSPKPSSIGPNSTEATEPSSERTIRVLLIGQQSPVRAQTFKDAGVARVDRSASWFRSMKRIDDVLFDKQPAPLGDRLSPAEARRRIAAGDYDLVIVEPVPGDAPATQHLAVPENTTLVAWFSPEQWIVQRDLGDTVVYSSEGMDDPCVAIVLHGAETPLVPSAFGVGDAPLFVPAGQPTCVPTPLARLAMHDSPRFEERKNWCRASFARRLADAARGTTNESLMQGFAILYAAQTQSSEFETPEERIELPQESLTLFEASTLARPPGALVRSLWEELARVLLGKRAVADIYKYLEPLAQKYPPWPILEQVLAQADLEALEPQSAARRLSAVIAARARMNDGAESTSASDTHANEVARQKDIELWYWLGEAQRQSGDHPSAARSWRRAFELQRENRALERQLAMELVRAGDPDGRKLIDELLSRTPGDEELMVFQHPGPYPEAPSGSIATTGKKRPAKSNGQ